MRVFCSSHLDLFEIMIGDLPLKRMDALYILNCSLEAVCLCNTVDLLLAITRKKNLHFHQAQ